MFQYYRDQSKLCLDSNSGASTLGSLKRFSTRPLGVKGPAELPGSSEETGRAAGLRVASPELYLLRQLLRLPLLRWRAMQHVAAFPLRARHEDGPHAALRRQVLLHAG